MPSKTLLKKCTGAVATQFPAGHAPTLHPPSRARAWLQTVAVEPGAGAAQPAAHTADSVVSAPRQTENMAPATVHNKMFGITKFLKQNLSFGHVTPRFIHGTVWLYGLELMTSQHLATTCIACISGLLSLTSTPSKK